MSPKKNHCPVKVWFEGLPQPIPARSEPLSDSKLLTVELPYLRRNTEVFVSDEQGGSHKGYMTEVTLVAGTPPRLQILVQTGAPAFEPVSEIPLMSPHPTHRLEAVRIPPQDSEEQYDPGDMVLSLDDRMSTVPLLSPLAEAAPETDREACPDAADPRGFSPLTASGVDPEALQPQGVRGLPAPPQEMEKPPSRRWMVWTLALLLAGLIAAGYSLWGGPARSAEHGAPSWGAGVPISVASASPKPAGHAPGAAATPASKLPAPAPVPTSTVEAEPRGSAPPVDHSAPRVWVGGTNATLVVPMEGSTRGMESYALSNPASVAVNLPHARLTIPLRDYALKDGGFRFLHTRQRKAGVHLRIFFHGIRCPPYKLKFDADAIRITILSAKGKP